MAQPAADDNRPSLPVILISAACGIAGGSIGLYLGYVAFGLNVAYSAGIATLCMLFGLGVSGAVLTAVSKQRNAFINIAFSCTLIVLVVLFMTIVRDRGRNRSHAHRARVASRHNPTGIARVHKKTAPFTIPQWAFGRLSDIMGGR